MCKRFVFQSLAALALVVSQVAPVAADSVRTERLKLSVDRAGKAISKTVRANEKLRLALTAGEGQTLSVDLQSNASNMQFRILPAGSEFPIHASALDGHVADIVIPETGDYVVDIFLKHDEQATRRSGRAHVTIDLHESEQAEELIGGPDLWAVTGLREGAFLNLRAGPSTRYQAAGQLQNGEQLQNNGCRLTLGKRWCYVRVPGDDTVGWVAGRFLVAGSAQ